MGITAEVEKQNKLIFMIFFKYFFIEPLKFLKRWDIFLRCASFFSSVTLYRIINMHPVIGQRILVWN